MSRAPRPKLPGGIYHVTARGNRRAAIFADDADRRHFISLFAHVVARFDWRCHAYCLMTNHYHLLVETPQPNISRGMHVLNWRYAGGFNARHALAGHLFERRFHSAVVRSELHLYELARYIVLNPVRAGICVRPLDWQWSSYAAMVGAVPAPRFLTIPWLRDRFVAEPHQAAEYFAEFVAAGVDS